MKTIEEMSFSNEIKKALKTMHFETLTPIQEKTTPLILENKDVIALAHTGSGKTVAFGIGILEKIDTTSNDVQVLILGPTRELTIQTANVLNELSKFKEGVRILSIFGGQQIDRQIKLLKKKPQIIVSTPGRLMDHMKRKTIRLHNIKIIILDEADEMLDMGFREDLDKILSSANKDRQTLLFSATMSPDIKKITNNYQKDAITIKIGDDQDLVPKIKQSYITTGNSKDKDVVLQKMMKDKDELTIIFCNTKSKVDSLKKMLTTNGFAVDALHGDMRQSQRHNVMKSFKSGKLSALITTDVAARGIDVNDIKRVINYDFPNDPKYYIHRIGRTARAGKDGISITFINPKEKVKLHQLEKALKIKIEEEKPTYLKEIVSKTNNTSKRLFISIGKLDRITGTKLINLIIEIAHVKEKDISNVEVFDKFSFFDIDVSQLDKVINNFGGKEYNKRRIGLEISNKPNTKFKKKDHTDSRKNFKAKNKK